VSLPPHAPWELAGECIVGAAWRREARSALPEGIAALPGPVVIIGVSYSASPVGPYLELALAEPARLGVRPGLCVTTMVVNATQSRVAGICNWGFPKELGTLTWVSDGSVSSLTWAEGGLTLVAEAATVRSLPVVVPLRALQRRSDGPVVVPGRVRGRARMAEVTVRVDEGTSGWIASLAGRHRGVVVRGLRLVVDPARHPSGLTAPLRAPLGAPEAAAVAARGAGGGPLRYTAIRIGLPQSSLPSNSGTKAAFCTFT
jgi:hypothetical protein